MGQASSSPSPPPPPPSSTSASASASASTRPTLDRTRRPSLWRRSFAASTALSGHDHDHDHDHDHQQQNTSTSTFRRRSSRPRPTASRSPSINRLSQFLHSSSNNDSTNSLDNNSSTSFRRPSRLRRARTSLNNFGSRHSPFSRPDPPHPSQTDDSLDFGLPNVSVPDLDLNFDHLLSNPNPVPRTPSSRSSFRLPSSLSDRISSFRSDRSARNLIMSTRRAEQGRRPLSENTPGLSPSWPWSSAPTLDSTPVSASASASAAQAGRRTRTEAGAGAGAGPGAGLGAGNDEGGHPRAGGEDNTALLSRLLSVAAAATAATLLDGNQQAIADARSVAGDGDDGTFSSFLQSLESGRLASALRQGGQTSAPGSTNTPLNFFRMFRFGSSTNREDNNPASDNSGGSNNSNNNSSSAGDTPGNNEPSASSSSTAGSDGRMVPIIIVGIRSVNPTASNNVQDTAMPPFLDALSALPTTPFGGDSDSIDNILRPAHRFSHRRRASMGGINNLTSAYDAQRHHASPDRARSHSIASNTAAPSLSRVNSANSASAVRPSSRPSSNRSNSNFSDRRESIIRTTTTTTTLETTAEDAPLRPRTARPRRLSESDYGRRGYSSRRNGIVEPDNAPTENTRSWIIYVLGGSYPENHPILTTPSLFTDSPTYEDMMLLSALLGPAKPPVASEQDVADAPGIFKIQFTGETLAAVALDGEETIPLTQEQRCLVCLCDFETDEEARRLIKCGHLFHKECIDQWLTKGRNSCPLCRGQGVDEKEKPSTTEMASSPLATDATTAEGPAVI